MTTDEAAKATIEWLTAHLGDALSGRAHSSLDVRPSGKFWLGLLANEDSVKASNLGDRAGRMTPCATGIRVRLPAPQPEALTVEVECVAWFRTSGGSTDQWTKTPTARERFTLPVQGNTSHKLDTIKRDLHAHTGQNHRLRCDLDIAEDGEAASITVVNETGDDDADDVRLYEVQAKLIAPQTRPFTLASLPDSFRYDRRVQAYGINCAVERDGDDLVTRDLSVSATRRPVYWVAPDSELPDISFDTLSKTPLGPIRQIVEAHAQWGEDNWSERALERRASDEAWTDDMLAEALTESEAYFEESRRLRAGLELLDSDEAVRQAFQFMNEAMSIASRGRYSGWRPFQIGFVVASLPGITDGRAERDFVDVLWFATGGGKTETYLGLLVAALFLDRLTGKTVGVTAWSRFPLRLLSLQQTQRFANAVCAANITKRRNAVPGDDFGLGFLVGRSATPNRIDADPKPGDPDSLDPDMPQHYQLLMTCPYCGSSVSMAFRRAQWRLAHVCDADDCPGGNEDLPIYIVDEEIYRFLPSVVVGTLDKVALTAMQAAMSGLVTAPHGTCPLPGHGFTYARRKAKPSGCLVPGCSASTVDPLPMPEERFPPGIRLQDELHLLRDSLGAVDSHYESLVDALAAGVGAIPTKVVASSATLAGYDAQCDSIYARPARVFPVPGPSAAGSFWSTDGPGLLRTYVAMAPRGVTQEFAADQLLTHLQRFARAIRDDPDHMAASIGIPKSLTDDVLSLFGTNVVYGKSIRDLEAVARSVESDQVDVIGPLNLRRLTGQTPFDEVAQTLKRLEEPEAAFDDRIHVVAASAMMSHGVDVDRLNLMVMLGVPLTTAEFIQATARIGRRWPGCVFVLHKMGLERDASVFANHGQFVQQGDRFVEPVPVTRHSTRVLERTLPGIVSARLRHVHERASVRPLTTATALRQYERDGAITPEAEAEAIREMLRLEPSEDPEACRLVDAWLAEFFRAIRDPSVDATWPSDFFPGSGPMTSLRDVEVQVPVTDT